MKTQKLLLGILATGALLTSCQKEETSTPEETQMEKTTQQTKISKEELKQIDNLHFNTEDAEAIDFLLPNGETKKSFLIEGDIVLEQEQLESMSSANVTDKQYRTYNLVSSPRNVNVIGFTGGSEQGLTSKQRTALQRAITNYNSLNIGLNFTLTFGTNYGSYDIVVYQNSNGQAGGVAGFPSGGDPYKYVQIFSGMENYSTATNEHVITHEIGHSVGLRHTDWYSRQSCGQSGESAGSDGAVHIPGTPTEFDSNSIMLACFSSSESGNFGYYDEVALEYLY
ncbi:peptidase [Salegentibacter salinarum]|uniref:Peptidase n=1 Tax=Salegentibacter salinarum TaxID=447422 RepID=A0A2N0U440_9FLAO|nr:M57 family metalloprotease [Salegentibacter salinarum]PKD21769.1 peptidase [Salegentibacter salinarum]SKB33828.1 Dual-action HEIGH metallo-peptidase [Salegentibacter salinarum]